MEKTLSTYLKTLLAPTGAPEAGTVDWEKTNLFGQTSRARVRWTTDFLEAAGENEEGSWRVALQRQPQGWEVAATEGSVKGGTPLARLRWVREQLRDLAQGAAPVASWRVPQAGARRNPKP